MDFGFKQMVWTVRTGARDGRTVTIVDPIYYQSKDGPLYCIPAEAVVIAGKKAFNEDR